MTDTRQRRADGAWGYDEEEFLAALVLTNWGLYLDTLDDAIEANIDNDRGLYMRRERARVLKLVSSGAANRARDAARSLGLYVRAINNQPLVLLGEKMTAGRKPGTVGKVRGWIRKYMAKHPDHKPAQAWEAFTKRPPKGCTVSGSNIWTDGAGNTSRAWFGTMVGQERPKQ